MLNTYAEFLMHVILAIQAETDLRKRNNWGNVYLCSFLDCPEITHEMPDPEGWKEFNAEYIKRLKRTIKARIRLEDRKDGGITFVLTEALQRQYPGTNPLECRVAWLMSMVRLHTRLGTTRSS